MTPAELALRSLPEDAARALVLAARQVASEGGVGITDIVAIAASIVSDGEYVVACRASGKGSCPHCDGNGWLR